MIENPNPKDWRDLQKGVCRLFNEIGLSAEEDKVINTPRGSVALDVFAVDEKSVDLIKYVVECKNWATTVPQSVVHSFTTVMHEVGGNLGFIISKKGLQKGAKEYTQNTNIIGFTYEELQARYFDVWMDQHFYPMIKKEGDSLVQYTEPINSFRDRVVDKLNQDQKKRYIELVKQNFSFGMLVTLYAWSRWNRFDNLGQLKEKFKKELGSEFDFRAEYYRELLDEILVKIRTITDQFNEIFGNNIFASRS